MAPLLLLCAVLKTETVEEGVGEGALQALKWIGLRCHCAHVPTVISKQQKMKRGPKRRHKEECLMGEDRGNMAYAIEIRDTIFF